jgi:hypothetical protein
MQIVDYSRAVACLVGRGSGVDVVHSVTHGVVEEDCDLSSRGGHSLSLPRRESPIKGAERGVGASNGYGSKPQKCRSPPAVVLKMRDMGIGMPVAAVLVSPWCDVTHTGDTWFTLAHADPNFTWEGQGVYAADAWAAPNATQFTGRCASPTGLISRGSSGRCGAWGEPGVCSTQVVEATLRQRSAAEGSTAGRCVWFALGTSAASPWPVAGGGLG